MSEENNILSKDEEFDILTLVDEDGKEHLFELADSLEVDGSEYVALIPVYENPEELLEDSGHLIIMKVVTHDDEDFLDPIEDDDEYDYISDIFEDRLEGLFEFYYEEDEEDDEDEED